MNDIQRQCNEDLLPIFEARFEAWSPKRKFTICELMKGDDLWDNVMHGYKATFGQFIKQTWVPEHEDEIEFCGNQVGRGNVYRKSVPTKDA